MRVPCMMLLVQFAMETFNAGVGFNNWTNLSTSSSLVALSESFTTTLNFTPIDCNHNNK